MFLEAKAPATPLKDTASTLVQAKYAFEKKPYPVQATCMK